MNAINMAKYVAVWRRINNVYYDCRFIVSPLNKMYSMII